MHTRVHMCSFVCCYLVQSAVSPLNPSVEASSYSAGIFFLRPATFATQRLCQPCRRRSWRTKISFPSFPMKNSMQFLPSQLFHTLTEQQAMLSPWRNTSGFILPSPNGDLLGGTALHWDGGREGQIERAGGGGGSPRYWARDQSL